jgi:hypothetical protein
VLHSLYGAFRRPIDETTLATFQTSIHTRHMWGNPKQRSVHLFHYMCGGLYAIRQIAVFTAISVGGISFNLIHAHMAERLEDGTFNSSGKNGTARLWSPCVLWTRVIQDMIGIIFSIMAPAVMYRFLHVLTRDAFHLIRYLHEKPGAGC